MGLKAVSSGGSGSFNAASPGQIGYTTPSSGQFTTVQVSSGVTGALLEPNVGGGSFALYSTAVTPAGNNFAFGCTGTVTTVNATGALIFSINGAQVVVVNGAGISINIGSLDITTAGQGLKVAEGANAKQGTGTLAAGTVTIANTSITASSRISLTKIALNGSTTVGTMYYTLNPGVGFTVTSYSATAAVAATDTSTFFYEIFEPG